MEIISNVLKCIIYRLSKNAAYFRAHIGVKTFVTHVVAHYQIALSAGRHNPISHTPGHQLPGMSPSDSLQLSLSPGLCLKNLLF